MLVDEEESEEITIEGPVLSCVYLNWVDAELLFPDESVNVFSAISIVTSPSSEGVKVAVYTLDSETSVVLIVIVPTIPECKEHW